MTESRSVKCSTLTAGVPRVFARAVRIIDDTYIRSRDLDLESNTAFSEQKNFYLDDVMCFFLNVANYAILKIIGRISIYHESS